MMQWPSREVALLQKQHAGIRHLLDHVELAAIDLQLKGTSELTHIAAALEKLIEALAEHNAAEEAALGPILASLDAWGPQRVEQMLAHHRAEHGAILVELRGLMATSDAVTAASHARQICRAIREHMGVEEQEFLNARVLRDDLMPIDWGGS